MQRTEDRPDGSRSEAAAGRGSADPPATRRSPLRAAAGEAGMTTAEYAVGTVAACGFAGVLFKLLTSDTVVSLLTGIVKRALSTGL